MLKKKTLILFGVFSIFSVIFLNAEVAQTSAPKEVVKPQKEIIITEQIRKKYPLKSHHAELSLKCVFCHEGQGDNPEEFGLVEEEACISCHKSKKYLAKRLAFMDKLHVNPHNSIHDGPTLYCDECHNEHKPSVNMCAECHEKEIKTDLWMRKTP